MDNKEIEAAQRYHEGTKHPGGDLIRRRHMYDPSRRPLLFKVYTETDTVPLPLDKSPMGVSALDAISTRVTSTNGERIPDLNTLARLLYFSAGITKKITYPWGEMFFRAASCTGALYHIELYVVCGDLPDLEAGVYHFDPRELVLNRLRSGDHRQILVEATAQEPSVEHAPVTIVFTDEFWRNAYKYQAREYRHAFWDGGTILGHTLAMAAAHDMPAAIFAGFMDDKVTKLLDIDTEREFPITLVPVGYTKNPPKEEAPTLESLDLETKSPGDFPTDYPAITDIHQASSLNNETEVQRWRSQTPDLTLPEPTEKLIPLKPHDRGNASDAPIERTIIRRGSTRRFSHKPISYEQLSTALLRSTRGIPADFLDPYGATLSHLYLIVNAVDGLDSGAYVFHSEESALEPLRTGRFREKAGHLALNQALGADGSVNIYLMTDLEPILERFGNRGYGAAQLDAGIIASKLYLASYAQGFGATGLTFFDDEVTDFFSPHARGKSVMFLIALGRKAKKS